MAQPPAGRPAWDGAGAPSRAAASVGSASVGVLRVSDDDYWKDFAGSVPSLTPRLLLSDLRASRPLALGVVIEDLTIEKYPCPPQVGYTEEQAKEDAAAKGYELGKSVGHFRANSKALAEGEGDGIAKVRRFGIRLRLVQWVCVRCRGAQLDTTRWQCL